VSGGKDLSVKIWEFQLLDDMENYLIDEFKPSVVKTSLYSEMGHEEEINVVRFSPNEKMIASAGYDKIIKIWDKNLKILFSLQGHKRSVTDVSFNNYAKILASTSTDKNIKIWNLIDGTCLNTLEGHLTSVLKVFWVYYGTHLISSGGDGLLKFWNIKNSECINTVPAHEGKIWAIDLISSENFEGNKELSKQKIKIFTAGTDSKLYEWRDITTEKENELLQEEELQIQKKEILYNYIQNRDFLKALKLSLEMDRKRDFINIFKEYFSSNGNTNDHINVIINNRKTLDEEKYENEQDYNKKIKEMLNDNEIVEFFKENLSKILAIVRDINILSSSFIYSQILLKIVLLVENYQSFFNENVKIGEKNKGFKYLKKATTDNENNQIDFIQNFEIIRSYSDKHSERINRQLMKTYLIDHTIEKMKLV
jgi:U3 small nucleolar RNA-associated protein 13